VAWGYPHEEPVVQPVNQSGEVRLSRPLQPEGVMSKKDQYEQLRQRNLLEHVRANPAIRNQDGAKLLEKNFRYGHRLGARGFDAVAMRTAASGSLAQL